MKLTFESNLNYQQEAIKSITGLFEGQPLEESFLQSELSELDTYANIYSYGNRLVISEEQMKIKCGEAHFNEFDDLEYKVVNKVGQLFD